MQEADQPEPDVITGATELHDQDGTGDTTYVDTFNAAFTPAELLGF